MEYQSTRNSDCRVSAAQAIARGLSEDGGLFVPTTLPELEMADLECLAEKEYTERAIEILSLFLEDFSDEDLVRCVESAYTKEKFGSTEIAPIAQLFDEMYLLELWHGPTCAFKDMALQLLPHLLTTSNRILHREEETVILVATSGDTGKAALEGFKDVDSTRIVVFYPEKGVSPMQKRQMVTQEGGNVAVCAIEGNFDDAQSAVKSIFTDAALAAQLDAKKMAFSSANSINWGRLVPQVVYYVSAYCDLIANGQIEPGDPINICVPTGNFGNILAAYYAKKLGVPVNKFICASNENHILTDFIRTGVYDRRREFYTTTSPSMDILISSNLERLLYDLSGKDDAAVRAWYASLSKNGVFAVDDAVKEKLQQQFWGGYCDDARTRETIADVFRRYSYLLDPHTAVAVRVYEDYRAQTGDTTKTLVASTANPYKFAHSVLHALSDSIPEDEYAQMDLLEKISGMEIPAPLAALKEKSVRFSGAVAKEQIADAVKDLLNL